MQLFSKSKLILIIIFLIALCFRLFGLNWDQGQHLHPDERFLTMVASDIKLPKNIFEYFDTASSPLNPYNYSNYQFFVYGTFPLFLTKVISSLFNQDNYQFVHLWGRGLSALFDSFNVFLLFFLARKVFPKKSKLVFLPSLFYAFCVLPLQLSHFFAVDTFLTTFVLATFTAMAYGLFPLAAFFFGLALSCKISTLYFLPIIIFFLFRYFLKTKNLFQILSTIFICLPITFFTFRFFQPYNFVGFFKLNPQFIDNFKTLKTFSDPSASFPPSVQWLSKIPLLFSLQNIVLWGLGLPLSVLFLLSLLKTKFSKLPYLITFSAIWILLLYFYQGSQFAHTMRYFLPIYPFLCLTIGYLSAKLNFKILAVFLIFHIFGAVCFLSIYFRPHSRIQASTWIYQNIPQSSVITSEYWDDALPLPLPGYNFIYPNETLAFYDPESPSKWQKINQSLALSDYLIMSSNRLWGSIPLASQQYPQTSKFYQDLFSEKLNFKKVIEINSYPGLFLPFFKKCYYLGPTNYPGIKNLWFAVDQNCFYPGIYFRDDTAEEAFTVYDHPKILIFRRI
ncbi:MAG: hypothetical protein WC596_01485 [Candidatus Shapirobacteria bacterium]